MNEVKDDWCDYIEQDYKFEPNKVQLVIDGETLEPVLEADRDSIIVMNDGLFILGNGNTLKRLPFNIQNERGKLGTFLQSLPEA